MVVTTNKVINILGISVENYVKYLHDSATNWLLIKYQNDTLKVDDVMQHASFWNWWALQAYHRDVQWLETSAYAIAANHETERLLTDWLYYHSASRLHNPHVKHAQLLSSSFTSINWFKNASQN